MNDQERRVLAAFQLKPTPVIIDPYDKIVQRAYSKLPPDMQKNIDVIKLEATCPGNKAAWVSNKDLLSSKPGKERIIHLCLQKIKDQFKKQYGSPFTLMDASRQKEMEEVIFSYLRDVILPHEEAHIQQELKGEGDFGPMAEPGAEKAEDWSALQQLGIQKKANLLQGYSTMKTVLSSKLDDLANKLESRGLAKEAASLDMVSNTLEMMAAQEQKVDQALDVVLQATPEEIQMAMKQLKGSRMASDEKEAGNLKSLVMALSILSGAMGAAGAEGWNPNDPNSKIPGVEQEQMQTKELSARRLAEKAKAKAQSIDDAKKMQAVLDMLEGQGSGPQTVFNVEEDKPTPDSPRGPGKGTYESPTRQRSQEELKRLQQWTSPQLGQ